MIKHSIFPYVLAFVLSVVGTALVVALAFLGGEVAILSFIAIVLIDVVIVRFVMSLID